MIITREVRIVNKLGLHARAAARLVGLATTFQADIRIHKDAKTVNGKSMMGILMLAAAQGTTLRLEADGPDAQDAVDRIAALIADRFGEGE